MPAFVLPFIVTVYVAKPQKFKYCVKLTNNPVWQKEFQVLTTNVKEQITCTQAIIQVLLSIYQLFEVE